MNKKAKRVLNDWNFYYILAFILGIALFVCFAFSDRARCEKNGGKYIWEWNSYGTKCHINN